MTKKDGAFVGGGASLTSEEAARRGAIGGKKPRQRKEGTSARRASRLANSVLGVMPPLATPEAEEARRLLVQEYSRLATSDKGTGVVALSDLARRIGDSFSEMGKLEIGDLCPRCKQTFGREIPQVVLNIDAALYALKLAHGAEYYELDRWPTDEEIGQAATVVLEFITNRSGLRPASIG